MPRQNSDRLSTGEVWTLLASLKKPFKHRDDIWPIRRRIRLRQEDPPVPDGYFLSALKHKSSEVDYSVRQIVALLSENKEQFIFYAPKDNEDMHRLADETREAVSSLMEMLEDQHPIERPRALCHDYQVADGVAIEKITFNYDFFSKVFKSKGSEKDWKVAFTEYVKENRELPIRKIAIDPLTAVWEFDINGLSAVGESGVVRKSALREQYSDDKAIIDALSRLPVSEIGSSGPVNQIGVNSGSLYEDGAEMVDVFEIWTRKHFYMLIEGKGADGSIGRECIVQHRHPFKRPPYFFAGGIVTGSSDPLHQFQPLVLPLYPLSLELSAMRTARFNAAFLSSFKPFYIKYDANSTPDDDEAGNLKVHFLMPGTDIPSIRGGQLVPIDWTNLDELEKVEQSVLDDRARYAFQAVLAGNAPSGESTAWATRMLRDQGMVQFNGVLRNFAQMREEEVRFIFHLITEVLKDDLPVIRRKYIGKSRRASSQELKITEEMASIPWDIEVRLSAGKASDRIAIVEEFRRAKQANEVPQRMVLEQGWGFDDATEILEEVTDEQMRQQMLPMLMQMAVQMASKGAQEIMQEELPQEPSADPAAAGAGGGPPSGELPADAVQAGLGQGLQNPEIPQEGPSNVEGMPVPGT